MNEGPLPPDLRPGSAAEIEKDLEHPFIKVSADQSQHLARPRQQREVALIHEHLAALHNTRFADLAPLVVAGIRWETIATAVPALACIRVSRLAGFQPDEGGGNAFIIPVRVENPITPEALDPAAAVCDGAVVDLVAFHPHHPDHWALRREAAEWLGAIEPQYLDPDPVPVWRTPLAWLRADCRGLVLLGDRASQYRILTLLHSIVAEDDGHAAELRCLLARPWPVPQVVSSQAEVRHAA
jgi:hypothetical protein